MSGTLKTLLVVTCLVILAAALQQAREIVVPFLLAVFIAIACAPPMAWLRQRGCPNWLTLGLVAVGLVVLGASFTTLLGAAIPGFRQALPQYYAELQSQGNLFTQWIAQHGLFEIQDLSHYIDPKFFLDLVGNLLSGFGTVLANALLIFLTVIFILMELFEIPEKIKRSAVMESSYDTFTHFSDSVNRYLATKTLTSFITGVLVAGWLAIWGVNHAVLWGLLAFLLNYIPSVGSILAAIPAVLLAWLQLGPTILLPVILGYVVINTAIGQFLETRLMGRRLGLSVLVVFLSLIFWGWLLGPVGMLLSIPLTIIIKLALEAQPATQPIAILLGPARETKPSA